MLSLLSLLGCEVVRKETRRPTQDQSYCILAGGIASRPRVTAGPLPLSLSVESVALSVLDYPAVVLSLVSALPPVRAKTNKQKRKESPGTTTRKMYGGGGGGGPNGGKRKNQNRIGFLKILLKMIAPTVIRVLFSRVYRTRKIEGRALSSSQPCIPCLDLGAASVQSEKMETDWYLYARCVYDFVASYVRLSWPSLSPSPSQDFFFRFQSQK